MVLPRRFSFCSDYCVHERSAITPGAVGFHPNASFVLYEGHEYDCNRRGEGFLLIVAADLEQALIALCWQHVVADGSSRREMKNSHYQWTAPKDAASAARRAYSSFSIKMRL
jgi:hypothetical protein